MRNRAAVPLTAALLVAALVGCSSDEEPAAKASATTAEATPAATIDDEAPSKECADDVFDMLMDEVNGGEAADVRPDSCSNLTDEQWSEVVEEQADKALAIAESLEDSLLDDASDDVVEEEDPAATKVTFKVWGSAPSGVDITYGSDTDNLEGGSLPMTETMKIVDTAGYYALNAQLEGSGDIYCSVTIGDETRKGHAKGGYNICSAQLNNLSGVWE